MTCRFRVIAIAIDSTGNIIDIVSNVHRTETGCKKGFAGSRNWHAEERIIFRNPRSIRKIVIARFNKSGNILKIEPCEHCKKLADERGIKIESLSRMSNY